MHLVAGQVLRASTYSPIELSPPCFAASSLFSHPPKKSSPSLSLFLLPRKQEMIGNRRGRPSVRPSIHLLLSFRYSHIEWMWMERGIGCASVPLFAVVLARECYCQTVRKIMRETETKLVIQNLGFRVCRRIEHDATE